MYVRPYESLRYLGDEIVYLDEITGEKRSGIVVGRETIAEQSVMVYVASPYEDENIHSEGAIKYRDIIMFDNYSNDIKGWGRDPITKEYGKYLGIVE